jgi:uncharacterized protein YqjF (DUF2071 family)
MRFSLADAVQAPARQNAALDAVDHRRWPLPESPWGMGQTCEDLLFAHWRAPVDVLAAILPAGLELDLYEDEAWIGVVPFRLSGLRARGLPPLPFVSSFLELNTRTYVTAGGKPGIWFFSLDASSELAVEAARLGYKLPYFRADIHHGPWPLQPAEAAIDENTMAPSGVEFTDEEPLLHFSARQDAVFWPFD